MNLKPRIRLTIGTKLVGIIALLLCVSVAGIVTISSKMVKTENTSLIEQMNLDTATALATQMRELFESLTEKMRVMGTILTQDGNSPELKDILTREFFSKDKTFLALLVHKREADGKFQINAKAVSDEFTKLLGTPDDPKGEKALSTLVGEKDVNVQDIATKGDVQLGVITLPDGTTALAVGLPFIENPVAGDVKFTHTLTALIKQERFAKTFGESLIVTSFMVDSKGKLLAHPDPARVASGENLGHLDIVKLLLEGKVNNGQVRYVDPQTHEAKLGAYRMVGFAGLGVVSEQPQAKAEEVPNRLEYRSTLIGLIVLSISFFVGFLFSSTISSPIKALAVAATRIAQGDFKIRLKAKGRDEVAQLSRTFNEMAAGLEERDRVKATFAKFHSKEMAEKVLNGELKLGGERKSGTVFFSDVRGFTAMSEGLDPEALVKILNRYMTRMVRVILEHGGVVDKYVGDAIMALWGLPLTKEGDVERAIRACLGMRRALAELNEEFKGEGLPPIKIGMGLNFGALVSGNIGSEERMEFTVIGDTVNTASRIESLTKEFGTDFLISKEVLEQVPGKFVVEKAHEAKVKGKSEPLVVYKVHGYIDEQGNEVRIETPWSSYAAEKSDKVVHDKPAAVAATATAAAAEPAPAQTAAAASAPTPDMPALAEAVPMPAHPAGPEHEAIAAPPLEFIPPPPPAEPQEESFALEMQTMTETAVPSPAAMVPPPPPAAARLVPPPPIAEAAVAEAPAPVVLASPAETSAPAMASPPPRPSAEAPNPPAPPSPRVLTSVSGGQSGAPSLFNRKSWYLSVGSEIHGPFSRQEISTALKNQEIQTTYLISDSSSGPWLPITQRPEFRLLMIELSQSSQKAA